MALQSSRPKPVVCFASQPAFLPSPAQQVHLVRDVAPKKLMVCVTFRVPPSIAFAGGGSGGEGDGAKRQRTQ